MTVTADQLTYIPFDAAERPRDGNCMTDRWWIVHPDKGLAIWKRVSPQCNSSHAISASLLENYPGHELRFMNIVYTAGYISTGF